MCREAVSVPGGLLTGPIFVNGEKLQGSGDIGLALYVYPDAGGVQHCEVVGMRDTLDAFADKLPNWRWLRSRISGQNWEIKLRDVDAAAKVHATVGQRFELPTVVQCATGAAPTVPAHSPGTMISSGTTRRRLTHHETGLAVRRLPEGDRQSQ
ncbi:DUF2235 domain-containing protein (plasmid) [Bradyrhizobium guangxiense]